MHLINWFMLITVLEASVSPVLVNRLIFVSVTFSGNIVLACWCSTFSVMLRSDSVISSAWTCLFCSYRRFGSRGALRHTALWCLSAAPLGKHHSGISHFMVSKNGVQKSACLFPVRGKLVTLTDPIFSQIRHAQTPDFLAKPVSWPCFEGSHSALY